MKKIKQGTKKEVKWFATCHECGSEFEEMVGALTIEDDRDGQMARSTCPDCDIEMYFYPRKPVGVLTGASTAQWGDH